MYCVVVKQERIARIRMDFQRGVAAELKPCTPTLISIIQVHHEGVETDLVGIALISSITMPSETLSWMISVKTKTLVQRVRLPGSSGRWKHLSRTGKPCGRKFGIVPEQAVIIADILVDLLRAPPDIDLRLFVSLRLAVLNVLLALLS